MGGSIGPTVPHAQIILTINIYIIHNVWKGVGGSKTTKDNKYYDMIMQKRQRHATKKYG